MQNFYSTNPVTETRSFIKNSLPKSRTFKKTSLKAGLTLMFLFLIGFQSAFAHAVQVGYAVLSNGFIRVYIEHWHGDYTTSMLVNNGMSITTTYGSSTVTQNVNPTGAFNNTAWNNLPGAGSAITILSKGPSANQYNDWAYYDFAPAACNVPVQITLNGGLTVVLTEESTNLWPQTITGTFTDTAAPTITTSNTTASVSCNTPGTTVNFSATALDNCTANPAVTFSIAPGSFFPVGTTNVTAYSTDANGNSGQLTFPVIVSVIDNVKPNLSVPAAIIVNNTPGLCGATVSYSAPIGTDSCSTPTTIQTAGLPSGSVFPVGTTVNTFKTTDAAGNFTTASFPVTVTDAEAPFNGSGVAVVSIPAGRTYGWSPYTFSFANQVPAGSVITGVDLAYSAVDQGWGGTGDWTNMQVAGTRIGGNQLFHHTQSFNINYNGSIPNYTYGASNNTFAMYFTGYSGWVGYFHGGTMTIHYEKDIPTVTAECFAKVTSAPSAKDNCEGLITGTTTDPLSYSAQGNYEISWTFKDSKGNSSIAKQKVIVKDITAPVAPVLADVTAECSATVSTPSAIDNCAGTITGTTTDSLTYSSQGTHVITWNFNDGNGNISTTSQNVVIKDITAPVVPALTDVIAECAATVSAPTTTDNCAGTITGTTSDALTYTAQGSYVITWNFNDGNGNTTSATQNVIVKDITAPVAPVLTDVIAECSATVSVPTTTDNCAGTITGTTSDPLTYTTQGSYLVTWNFNDGNGNVTTATQKVVVKDLTAPVALAKNILVTLVNGSASITAASIDNGSNDACGIRSLSIDKSNFDCSNLGYNTVILTVTDVNGNVSSASAIVNVIGVTPVASITESRSDNTFTGLDSKTIALGYGAQKLTLTASNSTSASNATTYVWSPSAGLSSTTIANPVFSPTAAGSYTFNVIATNEFGCSASASITITVIDVRSGNKGDKVLVCHKTNNKWTQISVSGNAVNVHLTNGGYLGACNAPATTAAAPSSDLALTNSLTIGNSNTLSAYPNPFAGQTTVTFKLVSDQANVSLDLYDLKGVKVKNVYSGSANALQAYSFSFDGSTLASGVYFFKLSGNKLDLNFKVIVNQ
jgi:hypothetical protein